MHEENVARVRAFAAWLTNGRDDAIRHAEDILSQPAAAWDGWLDRHPEAATLLTLQALLDAAPGDARGVAITNFVLRHASRAAAPEDAGPFRRLLRAHAFRIQGDALRGGGDARAALRAYEEAIGLFRIPPVLPTEVDRVKRAAAALRHELGESTAADEELLASPVEPPAPVKLSGAVARLLRETPSAHWPELADRRELQNVSVLLQLTRHAAALAERSPIEALAVTRLSIAIAGRLLSAPSPGLAVRQLAASAWAGHATALRLLARYDEAFAAYDEAQRLVPSFDRADLDRANIRLGLLTTLQEVGRLEEAAVVLRDCQRVFQAYGNRRGELLSAIAEGALRLRSGHHRAACELFTSILPMAEDLGDVQLLASVHHNFAYAAVGLGELALADEHLSEAIRLWDRIGFPLHVARAEMGRARMMIRRGEIERGVEHLHRIREQFLRHSLFEEAGLCGLEIVEVYLGRGASTEAETLARLIVREFTAARLNQRAIRALGYLSEAIAARKASQETVQNVRHYLGTLRGNPESEFVASA